MGSAMMGGLEAVLWSKAFKRDLDGLLFSASPQRMCTGPETQQAPEVLLQYSWPMSGSNPVSNMATTTSQTKSKKSLYPGRVSFCGVGLHRREEGTLQKRDVQSQVRATSHRPTAVIPRVMHATTNAQQALLSNLHDPCSHSADWSNPRTRLTQGFVQSTWPLPHSVYCVYSKSG